MSEPTDEQFAAAYQASLIDEEEISTPALAGRAMLAALIKNDCIPKQQGLTVLQSMVLQMVCGPAEWSVEGATEAALLILALGDPK